MHRFAKILCRIILAAVMTAGAVMGITGCSEVTVKADTVTDAANTQYVQQQALLQQYQNILLAQYQAGLLAQYQAALTAQAGMQKIQENAVNQAFLLNAVQTMQDAQYQAMVQRQGLEYSDYLLKEYKESQDQAMKAFLGYNGL